MASIELRQVAKSYGSHQVMNNVSFDIKDGEFVVFVGPSGCGKSTLLRMICGLEEISSGEVLIDGEVVNDTPARERDIAMVFQSYALYPHMTVEKNMGFSLRIDKRPKAEIAKKVAEAAEILNLTSYLKRKPSQLSGGQRQRVAMGRAIVRDPAVFLFDEPLSNLDAQLRVQMRGEITALQDRFKTTTVYVTHDQVEAMTMADRIVVLRDGNVEQVGAPLDLFDKPANLFVAQFIGSPKMNMINGALKASGEGVAFTADGLSMDVPDHYRDHIGREVILGIRPSDIRLGTDCVKIALSAQIDLIEATGTETMVKLTMGSHALQGVFKDRLDAKVGDSITIDLTQGPIHIFDKDTETRI